MTGGFLGWEGHLSRSTARYPRHASHIWSQRYMFQTRHHVLLHPPKQTFCTWKWGPLGKGDSYWFHHHFQVPCYFLGGVSVKCAGVCRCFLPLLKRQISYIPKWFLWRRMLILWHPYHPSNLPVIPCEQLFRSPLEGLNISNIHLPRYLEQISGRNIHWTPIKLRPSGRRPPPPSSKSMSQTSPESKKFQWTLQWRGLNLYNRGV